MWNGVFFITMESDKFLKCALLLRYYSLGKEIERKKKKKKKSVMTERKIFFKEIFLLRDCEMCLQF